MIKEVKGQIAAGKGNYAIVVSRFNEFVTSKLLAGAIDCLQRHGAADQQLSVFWVLALAKLHRQQKNSPRAANMSLSFASAPSYEDKPPIMIISVSRYHEVSDRLTMIQGCRLCLAC